MLRVLSQGPLFGIHSDVSSVSVSIFSSCVRESVSTLGLICSQVCLVFLQFEGIRDAFIDSQFERARSGHAHFGFACRSITNVSTAIVSVWFIAERDPFIDGMEAEEQFWRQARLVQLAQRTSCSNEGNCGEFWGFWLIPTTGQYSLEINILDHSRALLYRFDQLDRLLNVGLRSGILWTNMAPPDSFKLTMATFFLHLLLASLVVASCGEARMSAGASLSENQRLQMGVASLRRELATTNATVSIMKTITSRKMSHFWNPNFDSWRLDYCTYLSLPFLRVEFLFSVQRPTFVNLWNCL